MVDTVMILNMAVVMITKERFAAEFKSKAFRHIVERGYTVADGIMIIMEDSLSMIGIRTEPLQAYVTSSRHFINN